MIQKIYFYIQLLIGLFLPTIAVFAGENFVPLSKTLPNGGPDAAFSGGIPQLLNYLFTISIGVAAILAVIILVIGGFRYMTSESVFNMGNAKEQMWNAIIGILVVLTAVLILEYVNPDIVKLNLFE